MFVIKYDKVSMIRLVQSIERRPAIYDTVNHYSKEEQDGSWDEVALEVGEKDSLCRDRWHSIKSCYIRHLKYTALNSKRKPYYLAEFLDFLLPFVSDKLKAFLETKKFQYDYLPLYLKEAILKPTSLSAISDTCNSKNTVVKEEIIDIEDVDEQKWLPEISQQPSSSSVPLYAKRLLEKPVTSTSSPKKKKMKASKVNVPHKTNNTSNYDEDVKFFKNLLPDVARMSSHQKLKFKQEALSIIEDILYASEDATITD